MPEFKKVLETVKYGNVMAFYRAGTSDERVLKEVVDNRVYRRKKAGFDVEPGEKWLDLGANIGAFAVYCKVRGATAVCYEPEPSCFDILRRNAAGFEIVQAAVSASKESRLALFSSSVQGNHSRGSLQRAHGRLKADGVMVENVFAGLLIKRRFDGIKMDIEGAEGELIDQGLIPPCSKLCLEYHTSRDPSMANLKRRLGLLRKRFASVTYPADLDRLMAKGGTQKSFFDRMVYCRDPL